MFFSRYFTQTHIEKIIPLVTRSWDESKTRLAQRIFRCANYLPLSWVLWLATPWIKQAIATDEHPVEFLSTLLRGNRRYRLPYVAKPVLKTVKRLQKAEFSDFIEDFIGDVVYSKSNDEQAHGMETLCMVERLIGHDAVRRRVNECFDRSPATVVYHLCKMRYPPSFVFLSEMMRRYNLSAMLCRKFFLFLRFIGDEQNPSDLTMFYRDHGRARSVSPSDSFCISTMILLNNENIHSTQREELAAHFLENVSHFCSDAAVPAIAHADVHMTRMREHHDIIYYFDTPFGLKKYISSVIKSDFMAFMTNTDCATLHTRCLQALSAPQNHLHTKMRNVV